ncbi:DUF1281 domain-containing protein [Mixta tenebrionis]|jgi:hypothetical protein|uniref:Uncharacterized protein n=2 Tax=Mixta TaxID=2100764 RepID=A0A6P1Q442_9GAMM|nr:MULTISPECIES: DUF1281 domain-containing protein [Mixta]QHM72615.1 hypothetical protein C7M51_02933 [Mixta intestinalis]TPW38358.1 DUF1281 domain-containing protein [Mixta tenebrionis]
MSEWCQNRFEITGKSVCIDVLLQWITGTDTPRYRHAILQSIQLFLAGCAGILKPVRTASFPPCQGLVRQGTGQSVPENLAYEQWLELLQKDVVLETETIRRVDQLYHQSGVGALKWENIPQAQRDIMASLMKRQYADWFGLSSLKDEPDAAVCWERLREYPERSQPCDMLMIIPTRLATELNATGGLLSGVSTTSSFYSRIYGMEWPAGHNVNWHRPATNGLTLCLDSPWYPPSGEVVAGISSLFECEVRHTYSEPVSGLSGYDCYDLGAHVDGYQGVPAETQPISPTLYLVSSEQPSPELGVTGYKEIRG